MVHASKEPIQEADPELYAQWSFSPFEGRDQEDWPLNAVWELGGIFPVQTDMNQARSLNLAPGV